MPAGTSPGRGGRLAEARGRVTRRLSPGRARQFRSGVAESCPGLDRLPAFLSEKCVLCDALCVIGDCMKSMILRSNIQCGDIVKRT